jgi:hypothetical protein
MYTSRNTEAPSRDKFCHGKAISITYFCVCVGGGVHGSGRVALLIHQATRRRFVIRSLSGSTIFWKNAKSDY